MILISSYAETDYAELIAESPAAGFLAKSELSVQAIGRILGRRREPVDERAQPERRLRPARRKGGVPDE